MLLRIYKAQKIKPSPGDFVNLVKNDLEKIGLQITDEEISQIPKQKFKKMVKLKVNNAAFTFLKSLQQTHSKMKNIQYEKFDISKYLNSPLFSGNSRSLLLALRTRTVRGIRCDFPGMFKDKMCPLGCGENDKIENILTCTVLKEYYSSNEVSIGKVQYEDIFSKDIYKQKQVTELFEKLLEIRNRLVNSLPVACTGPMQSGNTLQNHSVNNIYSVVLGIQEINK